jgi:MFS-type transporter involved in bile tolerance (Atg22 family)
MGSSEEHNECRVKTLHFIISHLALHFSSVVYDSVLSQNLAKEGLNHTCVDLPEVDIYCLSSSLSTLWFETGS